MMAKFTRGKFEGEHMMDVALAFPKYIVFCYEKGTNHMGIPEGLYRHCKGRQSPSPEALEARPIMQRLRARNATPAEIARIQGLKQQEFLSYAKADMNWLTGNWRVTAQHHDETVYEPVAATAYIPSAPVVELSFLDGVSFEEDLVNAFLSE